MLNRDREELGNEDEVNIDEIMEEEDSEAAIMGFAEEAAPDVDINGCDTFTQIVDSKLEPGMGYANVDIGDVSIQSLGSKVSDRG